MHVHSTTTTPVDLDRLASLNVRYLFLAGLQSDLAVWSAVDPAPLSAGADLPVRWGTRTGHGPTMLRHDD